MEPELRFDRGGGRWQAYRPLLGRRNLPVMGSASIEADASRHGMSCDHCAASVTEEVQQVDGVTAVVVDLEAGRVTVRGRGVSDDAVRAAIDKAGCEVVGA
jgi:copper chaperone